MSAILAIGLFAGLAILNGYVQEAKLGDQEGRWADPNRAYQVTGGESFVRHARLVLRFARVGRTCGYYLLGLDAAALVGVLVYRVSR